MSGLDRDSWVRYEAAMVRFTAACERTTEAVAVLGVRFEMYAALDELSPDGDALEFENRVADWLSPRWRSMRQ